MIIIFLIPIALPKGVPRVAVFGHFHSRMILLLWDCVTRKKVIGPFSLRFKCDAFMLEYFQL